MNMFPLVRRLLPLLLGTIAIVARGGDLGPPDEAQLRAATTRSLGFLQKQGDKWMNERTCNSCHAMPMLLWSNRMGRERGIPIDDKVYDEVVDWSYERAKKDTQGASEVGAFLRLAMPEKPVPELATLLAGKQQADGSWKVGGQFESMQRRDAHEAKGNTMRVALLALAMPDVDASVADAARTKAQALLAQDETPKSVETLAFRTLYSRHFGPPEESVALRAELLELQHTDGGWSWMMGEAQSDCLATGEVLYVLQSAADPSAVEAIGRGRRWLLDQQREDGGWSIDFTRISKLDRSGEAKAKSLKDATFIYTLWGSAWATIGLLEGLPIANKPAVTAAP